MGLEQGSFFILKTHRYSEADLILQCLSSQGERVTFIAKNALRSKKRFSGGVLEPTHLVQFFYRKSSRDGSFLTLQEAQLLEDFKQIRKSYEHLTTALSLIEMIRRVSQEGDNSSGFLFNLLGHSLRAIEKSQNLALLKLQFLLKFLYQQGVLVPDLWMKDFLKFRMSESHLLEGRSSALVSHLGEMEDQVEFYLQTASASSSKIT